MLPVPKLNVFSSPERRCLTCLFSALSSPHSVCSRPPGPPRPLSSLLLFLLCLPARGVLRDDLAFFYQGPGYGGNLFHITPGGWQGQHWNPGPQGPAWGHSQLGRLTRRPILNGTENSGAVPFHAVRRVHLVSLG